MRSTYLPGVLVVAVVASIAASPALAQKPADRKPAAGKAPGGSQAKAKTDDAAKPAAKKPPTAPKAAPPGKRPEFKRFACSDPGRSYVEVSTWPQGKPVLLVHYPWKVHGQPSVEVRLLADEEPDTAEIKPLAFVATMMKGDVTLAVYRCLDLTEETRLTKPFARHDMKFEVVSLKNRLGNAAGQVIFPPKREASDTVCRVIFFPLEPWAADAETLRLELPAEHFSAPTRVRVWFYREGNMVWWQTVPWPGITR